MDAPLLILVGLGCGLAVAGGAYLVNSCWVRGHEWVSLRPGRKLCMYCSKQDDT